MPEKTKQNDDEKENASVNGCAESQPISDENSRSRDQREKSYYYDDAYGYEIYTPEKDDDDEIESER